MNIFRTVKRFFHPRSHVVLYRKGGNALFLEQALKKMEAEVQQQEKLYDELSAARTFLKCEYEKYSTACDDLEEELRFATRQTRIRFLVNRLNHMHNYLAELDRHLKAMDRKLAEHNSVIEHQWFRYVQLETMTVMPPDRAKSITERL